MLQHLFRYSKEVFRIVSKTFDMEFAIKFPPISHHPISSYYSIHSKFTII